MAEVAIGQMTALGAAVATTKIEAETAGGASGYHTLAQILALAPSGGGGGGMIHPGYVSGRWYRPFPANGAAATLGNQSITALPLIIAKPTTINQLALRVTTGIADAKAILAIYAHDESVGGPGAKLATTAIFDVSASASNAIAPLTTNLVVAPGLYWIAASVSAAIAVTGLSTAEGYFCWMSGTTNATPSQGTQSISVASVYDGTLPATFPTTVTVSTVACPLVLFSVL